MAGRRPHLGARMSTAAPVLQVRDLQMHFASDGGAVRAVDGVDFDLERGETLGLVGESGCGKSTLGRCLLRLYAPTRGSIVLDTGDGPVDLAPLSERTLRPYRRHIQMVFQDPFASLNPRWTVEALIAEPLQVHTRLDRAGRREKVLALMDACGLAKAQLGRYPHEFSGGQRQRIGIARALAVNPAVLVADEPISALDVSIRAQIMNLFVDLQAQHGLTYLFIAHDLAAVRHLSTRIAVMYLGRIVEIAPAGGLYDQPRHPYTQALISAVPIPDPVVEATRERIVLQGDPPSPRNPPPGCRFQTRCAHAMPRCRVEQPILREVAPGHHVACFLGSDEAG
jgi:oligopeptide/dipeptide ABC transporter ATP-binding protein